MHPKMVHVAGLYRVTQRLFEKALTRINPDDVNVRPQDKANSFLFVAGHITATRYSVAALLGTKIDWPHMDRFQMGAQVKDPSIYPRLAEIKADFDSITAKINSRLAEVTEEELAAPAPFKIPDVEESVGGIVSFLSMHESYHIGQLAYILRLHGGERLVG